MHKNVTPRQNGMKTALLLIKAFNHQPKHAVKELVYLVSNIALEREVWFGLRVRAAIRQALVGNVLGYKSMVKLYLYSYAATQIPKKLISYNYEKIHDKI